MAVIMQRLWKYFITVWLCDTSFENIYNGDLEENTPSTILL